MPIHSFARRVALFLPLLVAGCASADRPSDTTNNVDEGVVSESASDQVAFDFFVGKGLTDVQAAGIVGNLDQESGMSPTIAQSGGGPGRGIAQWSVGGRWDTTPNDNVAWYAAKEGESATSLNLQLGFIWYELTTIGYGCSQLRAATTVTEAVDAFQNDYEICGACASSNRIAHAQAALADFGGGAPPPSTGSSCTVAGVAGTCIATSACAAMPDYISTAGHCPGAADIECCTPSSTSSSSSSSSSSGGGSSSSSSSSSSGGTSSSSSGGSSSSSSGGSVVTCNAGGVEGTCIETSTCATMAGYTSTAGLCPGAADIECCTPPPSCTANGVDGTCIDSGACAAMGSTSTPGLCPGPANIECCTP